jgi:hypothetical protein
MKGDLPTAFCYGMPVIFGKEKGDILMRSPLPQENT